MQFNNSGLSLFLGVRALLKPDLIYRQPRKLNANAHLVELFQNFFQNIPAIVQEVDTLTRRKLFKNSLDQRHKFNGSSGHPVNQLPKRRVARSSRARGTIWFYDTT